MSFDPPASLEEALTRRATVVSEVQKIQLDLSNRNKTQNGERIDSRDYWKWRHQAVRALMHKTGELRALKEWIRAEREKRLGEEAEVNTHDPEDLLAASFRLLARLRSEGVEFDPPEIALINALQLYLTHRGASGNNRSPQSNETSPRF